MISEKVIRALAAQVSAQLSAGFMKIEAQERLIGELNAYQKLLVLEKPTPLQQAERDPRQLPIALDVTSSSCCIDPSTDGADVVTEAP